VAGQKLPEYRQCFFCPAVAGGKSKKNNQNSARQRGHLY
jgi:hypothetical protein